MNYRRDCYGALRVAWCPTRLMLDWDNRAQSFLEVHTGPTRIKLVFGLLS